MDDTKLIERLEAATGPDRELDAAIAGAFGHTVAYDKALPRDPIPYYQPVPDYSWQPVPNYSASIDAALTLVPEGWGYDLTAYTTGDQAEVLIWEIDHSHSGTWATAPTPALAICIAALRAMIAVRPQVKP